MAVSMGALMVAQSVVSMDDLKAVKMDVSSAVSSAVSMVASMVASMDVSTAA
jgi:hypothetical protein